MNSHELHYPNLEHCKIAPGALKGTKGTPPSLSLPVGCLESINEPLPELYDFRIEHKALRKREERENSLGGETTISRVIRQDTKDVTGDLSAFQKQAFVKMKSITNASDDLCVSILSTNGFKLNDSIESFYRGDR
eukprot:CAMPEP_0194082184 /NCGR_PEP_ID=MMETSP0149-20130528/7766_1 /TAXON_ID=122233 /ORGANISM="Chaetoceros debilis, Strain MM31A-1" /LENGTH=134 /DNA_ID=CAMNT_0038764273 /DNA_START=67 /DNA_END=471 /DNA_ORIENTATION=+